MKRSFQIIFICNFAFFSVFFPPGIFCAPLLLIVACRQQWNMGYVLCRTYSTMISLSLNVSIMTLFLISWDRLNAVLLICPLTLSRVNFLKLILVVDIYIFYSLIQNIFNLLKEKMRSLFFCSPKIPQPRRLVSWTTVQ